MSMKNVLAVLRTKLPDYVTVNLRTDTMFEVVIKKMGTSTLYFTATHDNDAACEIDLTYQDISFLHKRHMPKVLEWITDATQSL